MKKIIPHFSIDNCKDALAYYQGLFGGKIKNLQTGAGIEMFEG
ncbi:hypothetical protein ACFSO7_07840 [Bacillus sp. CGMCC 1.16607]